MVCQTNYLKACGHSSVDQELMCWRKFLVTWKPHPSLPNWCASLLSIQKVLNHRQPIDMIIKIAMISVWATRSVNWKGTIYFVEDGSIFTHCLWEKEQDNLDISMISLMTDNATSNVTSLMWPRWKRISLKYFIFLEVCAESYEGKSQHDKECLS